jgi:hypothetical protein
MAGESTKKKSFFHRQTANYLDQITGPFFLSLATFAPWRFKTLLL